MATPFSEVYAYFLSKISDYSFLTLTEDEVEQIIEPYLLSSVTKFNKCKKDLRDRDNVSKVFNEDLNEDEKNILATLMVVEYLTPKLITSDLLQQTLSSKDYKLYSQANHIKEIRELRELMKNETNSLLINYSYSTTSLDDLL